MKIKSFLNRVFCLLLSLMSVVPVFGANHKDVYKFLDSMPDRLYLPEQNLLSIALTLLMVIIVTRFAITNNDSKPINKYTCIIYLILTLLLSLAIIYTYLSCGTDSLDESIIINIIFFGAMSFLISLTMKYTFSDVSEYNGWDVKWSIGSIGLYVSAGVLYLDAILGLGAYLPISYLIGIYQIAFCIYFCIKSRSEYSIWVAIVWLITCMAAILLWIEFMRYFIIILIALFVLWLFTRPSSSSSSRSKRTYRTSSGEDLIETGINTYKDRYDNKWEGDGSGKVWKE